MVYRSVVEVGSKQIAMLSNKVSVGIDKVKKNYGVFLG